MDGQDSTNLYTPPFFFYQQPSVEALEEVSLQTGNYSAEFGQAQGGIYNFTAKSGTNAVSRGCLLSSYERGSECAPAIHGVTRLPAGKTISGAPSAARW